MRYYCHQCRTQINADELLPDFTCPRCHSGAVEEVSNARRTSSLDGSNRDAGGGGGGSDDGLVPGIVPTRMSSDEYSDDNSDVEFLDAVNGPLAQVFGLFQQQAPQQSSTPSTTNTARQSSQQQQQQQQTTDTNTTSSTTSPQAQTVRVRVGGGPIGRNNIPGPMQTTHYLDATSNQSLADVLNDFITGVSFGTQYPDGTSSSSQGVQGASGSGLVPATRGLINIDFPLPYFLHSNPGDYAWGNAGFDAVITQLLNNLDGSNSGPPPMPKDQVDNLPTVKISDEQVKNNNLQCTVCMDDFQIGDNARQLPCEHFFHQDCILPWLNLHASCPICRKTFVTAANLTQNINSDPSDASTGVNRATNIQNIGQIIHAAVTRNPASSTTSRNQNTAPNYDLTEEDCD